MFTSFVFSFLLLLFSCSCIIEKCHAMSEEASSRLSIRIVIIPSLCVCCLSRAARLRGEKKMAVLSGAREREEQQRRLEREKKCFFSFFIHGAFCVKKKTKRKGLQQRNRWALANEEPRRETEILPFFHIIFSSRRRSKTSRAYTFTHTELHIHCLLCVSVCTYRCILSDSTKRLGSRERERDDSSLIFIFFFFSYTAGFSSPVFSSSNRGNIAVVPPSLT